MKKFVLYLTSQQMSIIERALNDSIEVLEQIGCSGKITEVKELKKLLNKAPIADSQ